MKKAIEIQQENLNKLIRLMKENPELRVIPMVDQEVVNSDDYCYWAASFGEPRIDYIWGDDERIYFKDDEEDLIEKKRDSMVDEEEFKNFTDEEFDKYAEDYVENLEWEKIITLNIELPL